MIRALSKKLLHNFFQDTKNKKGTVVFICRRFNPQLWGGTETVLIQLGKNLNKLGYKIKIFTTLALSDKKEEEVQGIEIRKFSYCLPWFGLSKQAKEAMLLKGGNLLSFSLVWALLREPHLTIIHSHVPKRIGSAGLFAAKLRAIPFLITLHGGWYEVPAEQTEQLTVHFKNKFEWGRIFGAIFGSNRILDDADAVTCVGIDEFKRLQLEKPGKKVFYTPNGVDENMFKDAKPLLFREKYNISSDSKILLCLSRIDYQKNQLFLIPLLQKLLLIDKNIKLVLIGSISSNEYYNKILQQIELFNLKDNIIIIPGLNWQDPLLKSAYLDSDIFILPTNHEPFGIVILEAWLAGKPVVASNTGGIPGFVENGKDALLFEPGNELQAYNHCVKLLSDTVFSEKLACSGKKKAVDKFSWSNQTSAIDSIYSEIINGNNRG